MVTFKIRINGTPLAFCFTGEATGLDSAQYEFNKRMRRGNTGDCVELVAYENNVSMVLVKEYIKP